MRFYGKCNGYSNETLSETNQAILSEILPEARAKMLAWDGFKETLGFYAGSRFNDDRAVGQRIASAALNRGFLESPMEWALDALRDCAQADHWYYFIKGGEY